MASIIRIKRSSGTSKPSSLQWGEYGYVTGIGSYGGTNQYMKMKQRRQTEREELDILKKDIEEIKSLLKELTNGPK